MSKHPDDKKLQDEIRAKMLYGENYSVKQLYDIYLRVISLDFELKYKAVSRKSFGDKLRGWSSGEGSWLVGKGSGKGVTYHKWICHQSHMTRKQLIMTVRRMLERLKPW